MATPTIAITVPTMARWLMRSLKTQCTSGNRSTGLNDINVDAIPTCVNWTAASESVMPINGPASDPPKIAHPACLLRNPSTVGRTWPWINAHSQIAADATNNRIRLAESAGKSPTIPRLDRISPNACPTALPIPHSTPMT